MELVGYQKKYFERLYNTLVNEEQQQIFFSGCQGSGKSTIVAELRDRLQENWTVFHISGMGEDCPPYYTWYAAANGTLDKNCKLVRDISFGINFQPLGIPIGFEMNVNLQVEEIIFNNNEQTILRAIKKKVAGNEKILFIAEDYSSWDSASIEMLKKILLVPPKILSGQKIHVLFVDNTSFHLSQKAAMISIEILQQDISIDDISEIVNAQSYVKALTIHDLEKIIQFTGHDLRLINMAVLYQQEKPSFQEVTSLQDLLDKRISHLETNQDYVCQTLKHVSIINSLFSEKEAAYLLEQEPALTEKVLTEAAGLQLLTRHKIYEAYDFSSKELQEYFISKLDTEKKYLHFRFAKYLQQYYPDDYLSRSYHLSLSEHAHDEKNILEALYLLAIEIERRKELTGGKPEALLDKRISEMTSCLPLSVISSVQNNLLVFVEGNRQLNKGDYLHAINKLEEIPSMYSSNAFLVESRRLLLLAYIELADDLNTIKKIADELYEYIMEDGFLEDELWCRTSLILFEVYGDRHVQTGRFKELKTGFEKKIRKHMYKSTFQSLNAKYARKAALFFNAMLSAKLTSESCEFYRECHSIPDLYLSLCNSAANLMICGDYELADKKLKECKSIINDNCEIHFPSTYKIENNIIINTFLSLEEQYIDIEHINKEVLITAAAIAAEKLDVIRESQGDEVSHIIEFNRYSMLMISEQSDKALAILKRFKCEYKGFDAFYKYYYHNAELAFNLLTKDYLKAQEALTYLEDHDVLLLNGFSKILTKRNQIIKQLIVDEYNGNAFKLNYELIKRGMRIQDPSASYWGRIFLFSDLQFLSM